MRVQYDVEIFQKGALDKLETYMIKNNYWAYDFVEATQFMIDNCDEKTIAMYHITADDRVMGGINKAKKLTQTVQNSKYTTAEGKEIQRIYVSTLCPNDTEPFDTSSYAYELATLSGGIAVTGYVANEDTEVMTAEVDDVKVYASNTDETKTSSNVKKSLTAILGEGNNRIYRTIMSNGLVYVKLDTPLRHDEFYRSRNLAPTDTDHDGLYDWHEVDIDYINEFLGNQSKETIKTGDLPTIGMYVSDYSDVEYVQQGYEIFITKNAALYYSNDKEAAKADIDNYRILPIISDPIHEDGDGDDIKDVYDIRALISDDEIPFEFKKYINNKYIAMESITFTNDGFALCNQSLADILNEVGIYNTDYFDSVILPVQNWYDDWYMYSVTNDVDTVYGLLKMREVESDYIENRSDKDETSVAISFAQFNIESLSDCLSNRIFSYELGKSIETVTSANIAKYNDILASYFAKTESHAPYIIADAFVYKIANSYPYNIFSAPPAIVGIFNRIDEIDFELSQIIGVTPNGPEQTLKINLEREKKISLEFTMPLRI